MFSPEVTKAISAVAPECVSETSKATAQFSAAQVNEIVEAALAAQSHAVGVNTSLTLTGHQLRAALQLQAWPEESDAAMGDTTVTLTNYKQGFQAHDDDGEAVTLCAGIYLSYDDLPEEGIHFIEPAPMPEPDAGLAQVAYDAIGNEIFKDVLLDFESNPDITVLPVSASFTKCLFKDGSLLVFSGGFAKAYPVREERMPRPKVRCCTLTGIDESTNLDAVWDLAKCFPFAEFGVLYSDNRAGAGRYPSKAWIDALCVRITVDPVRPNFALHVCGSAVRQLLDDPVNSGVARVASYFGRVQLNFISKPEHVVPLVTAIRALAATSKVIIQINTANGWLREALAPYALPSLEFLFDSSGGRGKRPDTWPAVPAEFARVPHAYSGGLGPENLADQLFDIYDAYNQKPVSVDMESSMRTADDRFDMNRAAAALRICSNANFHH